MTLKFGRAIAFATMLATLSAGTVSAAAAERLVYIPLGSAGKVVVVDAQKSTVVREIKDLDRKTHV